MYIVGFWKGYHLQIGSINKLETQFSDNVVIPTFFWQILNITKLMTMICAYVLKFYFILIDNYI